MRSRNPLFRRASRLNELQITDMALAELEQTLKNNHKTPSSAIPHVGKAIQQKIKHLSTAPNALTQIVRRALSSDEERYECVTDMILDLHRARSQIETEMQERLKNREIFERERIPWYERAIKPMSVTLSILICTGSILGVGLLIHYLYPNGVFLKTVEVPQMIGQNLNEITADSDLFDLDITYQFHRDSETGVILSQSPQAGMMRRVSPGRHPCTVTLHVSLGPEQVQVGAYTGMTKYQALTECRRLGLIPKIKKISDHPAGNVAKSDPPAGTVLKAGSDITLYVGTSHHVSRVAVPNMIGNSEIGASGMLSSLGLVCSRVSYMESDQPVGTVIAQSILSGTSVSAGTKVSIVVSKGKTS